MQMVAGFRTLMQRVDALDAAGRVSEMCEDPQQIPLPENVCAYPRIAALIRQTLAYAPDMRPSAAAALDEAVSIWQELLRDRSKQMSESGPGGDSEEQEDWEDYNGKLPADPGYISNRLFARWSSVASPSTPIH